MEVVAVGIGNDVDLVELQFIASDPHDINLILLQDFNNLMHAQEQVLNATCHG